MGAGGPALQQGAALFVFASHAPVVARRLHHSHSRISHLPLPCQHKLRLVLSLVHAYLQVSELGVKAEVGIFNSVVAACAHSGEHGRARGMFDAMPDHGCAPDAVTFANLIRAYKKVRLRDVFVRCQMVQLLQSTAKSLSGQVLICRLLPTLRLCANCMTVPHVEPTVTAMTSLAAQLLLIHCCLCALTGGAVVPDGVDTGGDAGGGRRAPCRRHQLRDRCAVAHRHCVGAGEGCPAV